MMLERCPGCGKLARPTPTTWEGLCNACDPARDMEALAIESTMYHDLPARLEDRLLAAAAQFRRLRGRMAELEDALRLMIAAVPDGESWAAFLARRNHHAQNVLDGPGDAGRDGEG